MKTAKRALAVMIAVLMVVSTCVIAASAATSLQAKIDAAAPGDTVTLDATANGISTESVTVNKDITIDLNCQTLFGEMDKAAITVLGGNVTVTNGQVTTTYATNKPTKEVLKTVFDHCPPAILVRGGELTVEGVRITGGQVRMPGSSPSNPDLLLAGSGIMSYNGAPVTLKRTSIYGDYGVNNAVRQNPAGGLVTVEDAIILAYTKAIKGQYEVAEGSEEIIAADRISGVFNEGLNETEQELAANLLTDRSLIVSKTAEQLTAELEEIDPPLVTKIEGESMASIVAPTIDYSWQNDKGTDCSYRLVPEYILLNDGTSKELAPDVTNTAQANLIDDTTKILYRVQYFIGVEAKPYIESLTKEGLDNPLDGAVAWAATEANNYYKQYTVKNNNNTVDSYDEAIQMAADLMETIDTLGNKTAQELLGLTDEEAAYAQQEEGVFYVKDLEAYKTFQRALYDLVGKTAWAAKSTTQGYEFTQDTYEAIYGAGAVCEDEDFNFGTLDKIDALKQQMEAILGDNLFLNTAAYGDLFVWAVETAYPELLNILDDADVKLTALKNLLNGETYAAMTAGMEKELKLLDDGIITVQRAKEYLDKALANGDVSATIDYVTENSEAMKGYVEKIIEVAENWRTYITPEKFLVNDEVTGEIAYVKTYSTKGPIAIEEIEGEGNLAVTVNGKGTATVDALTTTVVKNSDGTVMIPFDGTFTLTATPNDNYEFLFWVNKESGGEFGRILSTEPTFTWKTNLDRDIEAVFGRIGSGSAYFTNPTGDICGFGPVVEGVADMSTVESPSIAGYGFVGWPGATADGVSVADASTDYFAGNSAFATMNAYYGPEGAVLYVRPGSSAYIITPVYSKQGGYKATFIDGDTVWVGEGNYSDIATYTATAGDYWVIDGTDTIVCVNKTFPYQMIDNVTFRSVAGECPENTVTKTTIKVENGSAVFYIERSTNKAIKTVGMVYSVTKTVPTYGETGCWLTSSKSTVQTGLYAPSIKLTDLGGYTLYGVPYIEFADGTYYEGAPFQYPAN